MVLKISVIMSVYNGERYLRDAVDSILGQTFRNFEFLIIDDASTDDTAEIIRSYHDPRIMSLRNPVNKGLTESLNVGLHAARGEYIARMDADDISLPDRLRHQSSFLDLHPGVGLVASSFIYIDEHGNEKMISRPEADPKRLKEKLLKGNQFCHGVVMFRRSCFEDVGGYRKEFRYTQDYDLWLRILEKYEVASLDTVLFKYRVNFDNISVSRIAAQTALHSIARKCARRRRLGLAEDLDRANKVSENKKNLQFIQAITARHAMSSYHVMWGRSLLACGRISEARDEFIKGIKTFPFSVRLWFFLIASLAGGSVLRRAIPLWHSLKRSGNLSKP